jgi:glucose/arabinose dehydrogenase
MRCILLFSLFFLVACDGGGGGGGVIVNPPDPPPPDPDPVALELQQVFTGLTFSAPMAMLQAPGDPDHWYMVERAGLVWRFQAIDGVTTRTLYTDISNRVSTAGEGGLLGMAFHPQYDINRRLFLSYTAPGLPLESRLSELTAADDGLTADSVTEAPLLTVQQDASNHNGGHIAFGPDGFLYFGLGDGGGANDPNDRAQDTTNLLGAMLALDIDAFQPYTWPASNPFSSNPVCVQGFGSADCPEIHSWGLRNPWRFSFDRDSGELWLGDVGQGDWEEINIMDVGANYGWPTREGAHCNPNLFLDDNDCDPTGLTDPVAEYSHNIGNSITGGYIYRGSAIAGLNGHFLFGDFITGRIWRLVDGAAGLELEEMIDSDLSIVSFAEESDGTLYVLDVNGGIYRIVSAN